MIRRSTRCSDKTEVILLLLLLLCAGAAISCKRVDPLSNDSDSGGATNPHATDPVAGTDSFSDTESNPIPDSELTDTNTPDTGSELPDTVPQDTDTPSNDTGSDTATEPDSDSDTGPDSDSDTGPDSDSDTGPDSDSDTGSDSEPDTDTTPPRVPKNIILFIGDGMGQEHLDAASIYRYGQEGRIFFERFPITGLMTTHSAGGAITDSAASATAMATGQKVDNYVVGLQIPGDGNKLENLTEYFQAMGKATGLVTTCTITHATPAGFAAHTANRNNTLEIAEDYMNEVRPNLLFGGGGSGMTPDMARLAGYTVVETLEDLNRLQPAGDPHICGHFGTGFMPYEQNGYEADMPHLFEMGRHAVRILEQDPDGFFLMVEGGRIDHAAHANRLDLIIPEILVFEQTIMEAVTANRDADTLFIVTADHSTGGLTVLENNGIDLLPIVDWSTGGHTNDPVPIFVVGPGQKAFENHLQTESGVMDNTDIHTILTEQIHWY